MTSRICKFCPPSISDLIFCSCTPPYILFLLHSQSTALLGFLHSLDTSPQQLFHLLVPLTFCNLQFNCDHQPPCSLLGSPENSATLQIVSISFQKIWQLTPASLTTKRKTTHRKWIVINTSLVHSRGNPLCAATSQEVGIILFSFYRLQRRGYRKEASSWHCLTSNDLRFSEVQRLGSWQWRVCSAYQVPGKKVCLEQDKEGKQAECGTPY